MDIDVESVWASVTGAGVNVAVVDETIDYSHEDLAANVDSTLSYDYGPLSSAYRPYDHHGTYVAGVIAARDNAIGVRGVAPRATIYGYNLLGDGGALFSHDRAVDAMSRNQDVTGVSNNSWSLSGDSAGFFMAPTQWWTVLDGGVTQGYGGKGVFYVFAAGNGHPYGANSNLDEMINHYGVTAVCAVGAEDTRASSSEQGVNLWVCAPSQGLYEDDAADDRAILTTENSDRYTNAFNGTSAATPIVSGVVALLRQVNPALTWRDLKLILAASARKNDPGNTGWTDGARKYGSSNASDTYHFNREYGFGTVDAGAAVALARSWSLLPPFLDDSEQSNTLNAAIPDNNTSGITSSLTLDTDIEFTEFVEVEVTIDHSYWRDLQIELESPDGAVSTLAVAALASSSASPGTFRFGSAKHLGENPNGEWELRVSDQVAVDSGTLESWSIKVYGHGFAVRAVSTGLTTATATVWLHNPDSASRTVNLRHRHDDGTTWSTPAVQTATGASVEFRPDGACAQRPVPPAGVLGQRLRGRQRGGDGLRQPAGATETSTSRSPGRDPPAPGASGRTARPCGWWDGPTSVSTRTRWPRGRGT